jgi:hypothetical protein
MKPDGSLPCTKSCHPYPEPAEYNPRRLILSRYDRLYFNPSAPRASMWPLSLRRAHLYHGTCHIHHPYHPPSFDNPTCMAGIW